MAAKTNAAVAPSNPQVFKIGQIAEQSGVAVTTLRFYERIGLIDPPARTASGFRMYPEATLARLSFIARAQFLGFSLDEIARIIEESRAGRRPCREVRELIHARLGDLDDRIRKMREHRRYLARLVESWDRTGEADGDICGFIESLGYPSVNRKERK